MAQVPQAAIRRLRSLDLSRGMSAWLGAYREGREQRRRLDGIFEGAAGGIEGPNHLLVECGSPCNRIRVSFHQPARIQETDDP